jgi:hypothetical protein
MATLYFKLEQIATVGSPTTGSTVYMAWPDGNVPTGNDRATTVNLLTTFPNSTWAFRSRTWKVTNLGSAPIPFDTQMITGEPWNYTSNSLVAVYIGFTFNINTTFFAQNYIDVRGSSGTFKSPRYITNFYSANTFNNVLKVIGTDTNRYDYIFPTTANDYNHITNNGVLNYDFNSSTIITYDITPGTGNYGLIPETATSAVNYFNGLYDGWTSDVDDCFGNIITDSSNRIRYVGDLHDRSESFASKWGGPCLRVNNVQTPYSGTPSSGFDNIVLGWYTDCSDCQTTNLFNNIYKFTADENCSGISQGIRVFSASTLTWGSPLGGGSVTPQFVQIKAECFGGEDGPADQALISAALVGDSIDDVFNSCVDCENNVNAIDEYYYFSACSTNKIFRFNVIDFNNDFSPPAINNTYLFENVGGVNGCFTYISDPLGNLFVTITYWNNTGPNAASVSGIKCTDVICQQTTPTPTPTNTTTPTVTPTVTPTSSPFVPPSYTPTSTPTVTPTPSSGTGCFSGDTDGVYSYTDCCGNILQGTSVGEKVCVDTNFSYQGIRITNDPCVDPCDEGPITYSFEVTGTCTNPKGGIILISPSGGTKPYTIQNTSTTAAGGLLLGQQTGNGPFSWGGVDEGSYVFLLQDSSGGVNQDVVINVNVEGCFNATITSSGTTCGNINGVVTVTNDSLSSPFQYDLYDTVSGTIFQSFNSFSNTQTFTNIGPATYYCIVTDFGGATAQTTNTTVVSTDPISYNILVVPDSPCGPGVGTATVTNLLGGTPPYTYLWSNGQTTQTATGLSVGSWGVTVTDSEGCRLSQSINVGLADPLGIVSTVPTQAGCFDCDGQVVVTISGGTSPYTYQNSAGEVITSNNLSESFTGLCGGFNSTLITDAGGCSVTAFQSIPSTAGFTIVNIGVTNSDCNDDGSISISISAPAGIFTYEVTNGLITDSTTTSSQSHTFNNLPSGTYTVTIVSQNGNCTYSTDKTISNNVKFNVNSTITDGTCGDNNGIIDINLTAGSVPLEGPFDYILTDINTGSVVYSVIDDPSNTQSITSLAPSTYLLNVIDIKNCTVSQNITITPSTGVNFIILPTECVSGNDGMADITISEGVGPFNIQWSNGETTMSITGLSGDTYTATITDNNGCSATESVTINCNNQIVECYEVNEICENDFITTSAGIRDFGSMLNEGYLDLTVGHDYCTLVNAVFYAIVDFSGGTMTPPYHVELPFYTGTTLGDYPSAQDWINAIDSILKTIPQIESVTLDIDQNLITIISDCKELKNVYFRLSTKIVYDICCNDVTPTPTPTQTSTPTPTPTTTLIPTPTPTPTPTTLPLVTCIESLTFIVEYNQNAANGSQCPGTAQNHSCNRARFDITANGVDIGQVSMNNVGGFTDLQNYPPNYNPNYPTQPGSLPGYPGQHVRDRYSQLSIDSTQAQAIAAASPTGLIDFDFDCACIWSGPNQNCSTNNSPADYTGCHTDVSWVRVVKDLGLPTEEVMYNDCPSGNFITGFDPCDTTPPGYNSLGLFFGLHGGGSSQPCSNFNGGGIPNFEYFTDVSVSTFLDCPTGNSVYAFTGGNPNSYVLLGNGAFVSDTGCIFNVSNGVVTSFSQCLGGNCSGIGSGC